MFTLGHAVAAFLFPRTANTRARSGPNHTANIAQSQRFSSAEIRRQTQDNDVLQLCRSSPETLFAGQFLVKETPELPWTPTDRKPTGVRDLFETGYKQFRIKIAWDTSIPTHGDYWIYSLSDLGPGTEVPKLKGLIKPGSMTTA